jgi:hypothetical protein
MKRHRISDFALFSNEIDEFTYFFNQSNYPKFSKVSVHEFSIQPIF